MRVVARAYRPRVTPTAYGRATGLPSFRPNQQYRADTPHFQDRRYRRQESKIYDHSIRYQHHDTHELRATTATAVEIADNRRNADETSAASDLSKATPLRKGKGKGGGKGGKSSKGGRGDGETRKCDRCGLKGGHKHTT